MKIEQTVQAWIPDHSEIGPQDFLDAKEGFLGRLYYARRDMTDAGWTRAGMATITLEAPDREALIDGKIESLKAKIDTTKAEAHQKVMLMEEQIKNLLSLTYEPN